MAAWKFLLVLVGMLCAPGMAAAASTTNPFIPLGAVMETPTGYAEMCARDSAFCAGFGDPAADTLPDCGWLFADAVINGGMCVRLPAHSRLRSNLAPAPLLLLQFPARLALRDGGTLRRLPWASRGAALALATGAIVTDMPKQVWAGDMAKDTLRAGGGERDLQRLLKKVNAQVNRGVRQIDDARAFGRADVWRASGSGPGASGDCEDLSLEKRSELIAAGFPRERLFMAVVFRQDVGLHAVLLARMKDGDVVLDSRIGYLERWHRSGYAWISIETPGKPAEWRAMG